ncbi:type-F conjugative transfer system mating-pair stabilization protein TraN [Vibrio sp. Vb339]|uniref:type-F conjugative transfer system mating-pair stabilization protein TraN n=1 Tax=Vibrio sp. Vb339 TaxID=1192013 RepID=UPI001555826B|nr:type-F conjugative transfer system mating-pair stabilization protein TraN [Vibrio sp. Vb339]
MRRYLCVVLALSLFSASALTSEQQTFTDAASWAKQTAKQALKPSSLPLNIDDYCKDAACQKEIQNPNESRLSDRDINSQKDRAFANNETAQAIQNTFNKGKPDIKHDPTMRFALLGQDNAFEVTHGMSNAYVDCETGTQCLIEDHTRMCTSPTNTPVTCFETPYVSKQIIKTGRISFHYNGFTPIRYSLPQGVTEVTGINFPGVLTCQGLMCIPNKGVRFRLNGIVIHTKPSSSNFNTTQAERVRCKSGGSGFYCLQKYSPFYQATGIGTSNNITIDVLNDYGLFNGTFTIHYKIRKNVMKWQSSCSTLLPECKKTQRTCIKGRATHTMNGLPTTLNCWKYQVNHLCELADSCARLPKNCNEQSRACSLQQNGVCVEEEIQKSCPEKSCRATQMQCGEQSFCLDGDCYVPEPKLNDHFDKSVAALAGLAEAVKDVGDPPKIFTGKPMQCDQKLAGFNDCCKDSGWGHHLGAKCSEGEKALGKAKEKGLTLYVGQYCAKKVLGVCTRKKRSYCVYDSKLAKIIQEQGAIQQLGKGLGSAKHPTCAAITPEELGQINFEHIDFSEFYPDMHANTHLPNFDEIKQRLQSATGK